MMKPERKHYEETDCETACCRNTQKTGTASKSIVSAVLLLFLLSALRLLPLQVLAAEPAPVIYIGDSRTCFMQSAVNGGGLVSPVCLTDAQGRTWSAKYGMGYDWLESTGIPQIEAKINAGTQIIVMTGVNDCLSDDLAASSAAKHAALLNRKAAGWKKKGAVTYFLSVNPLVDSSGRKHKNSCTLLFNRTIRPLLSSDVHYIDSAGKMDFRYRDGLHFTNETSRELFDFINNSLCDFSLVYDFDYYVGKYPDLQNAVGSSREKAFIHFLNNGMQEGRQGKASFDAAAYQKRYPDLRNAYGNDFTRYFLHYMQYGAKEHRSGVPDTVRNPAVIRGGTNYSSVYDYNWYITHNPDVARVFGHDDVAALRHFVLFGMKEARQANDAFSVKAYRSRYADLQQVYGSDWTRYYLHYIRYGKQEGRNGR